MNRVHAKTPTLSYDYLLYVGCRNCVSPKDIYITIITITIKIKIREASLRLVGYQHETLFDYSGFEASQWQ